MVERIIVEWEAFEAEVERKLTAKDTATGLTNYHVPTLYAWRSTARRTANLAECRQGRIRPRQSHQIWPRYEERQGAYKLGLRPSLCRVYGPGS